MSFNCSTLDKHDCGLYCGPMFTGFFSDPHFGHKNIITYCDRPFKDVEEMTEALIANYNRDVPPDGEVWWLGDAFFSSKGDFMDSILARMNGKKHLIRGNHDRDTVSRLVRAGFSTIQDRAEIRLAGVSCVLNHYPYGGINPGRYPNRRPKHVPGTVLLHGHAHSKPSEVIRSWPGLAIDCGVDGWDYGIVTTDRVEFLIKQIIETRGPLP